MYTSHQDTVTDHPLNDNLSRAAGKEVCTTLAFVSAAWFAITEDPTDPPARLAGWREPGTRPGSYCPLLTSYFVFIS